MRLRPHAAVVAVYLALTAVPLAAALAGAPVRIGLALLAHLATLAAVVLAERRVAEGRAGPGVRLWADLHLLLLIPPLYWELPLLMEGMPGAVVYRDALVQAGEAALFGFQPAWELAGRWPWWPLSEAVHLGYLLYYPIIYVPPLLVWWAGRRGSGAGGGDDPALGYALTALGLSAFTCYLVFVVFPVQGPRFIAAPEGVPSGPLRALALAILEGASSRGAAFPSSHVAIALTQTLVMLRLRPRFGRALAVVTALLALGAVYGGFHYGVDALAGAAFGAAAFGLAGRLTDPARPARPGFAHVSEAV